MRFSSMLHAVKHTIQSPIEGLPGKSSTFDSHTNVPPVTDHILCGIIKNTLLFSFDSFCTDGECHDLKLRILCGLSENGLLVSKYVTK